VRRVAVRAYSELFSLPFREGGGLARRVGSYGTGSQPPGWNGWQRHKRRTASPAPRQAPCRVMACAAYSEQVGENRQDGGVQRET